MNMFSPNPNNDWPQDGQKLNKRCPKCMTRFYGSAERNACHACSPLTVVSVVEKALDEALKGYSNHSEVLDLDTTIIAEVITRALNQDFVLVRPKT